MDQKAAVLLVSRALALLQGICALIEASYLPERIHSYLHYARAAAEAGVPGSALYLVNSYRVTVAFLFVRIAIYLALAMVFWKCPYWVESSLMPEREP
jgi:hypothetical protein